MDAQQMLGVLLNTTEQQSQTTEKLLAALAAQIAALNASSKSTQQAAAAVDQAARNVAPAIQQAAGGAIDKAVRDSLAGAAGTAAAALNEAAKPVLGKLAGVVQAAGEAEGKLKTAGQWFAWKWVAVAAGGMAGVCMVAYVALAWQLHQVSALGEEKAALKAEVIELQAGVAALAKKGGRIKIGTCGPDDRLCVEVAHNQGKAASQKDFKGSWRNDDGKQQFIIPKGY